MIYVCVSVYVYILVNIMYIIVLVYIVMIHLYSSVCMHLPAAACMLKQRDPTRPARPRGSHVSHGHRHSAGGGCARSD